VVVVGFVFDFVVVVLCDFKVDVDGCVSVIYDVDGDVFFVWLSDGGVMFDSDVFMFCVVVQE